MSAVKPVEIDHPLVHIGHSWLWLCPQSPRAASTEAFWEETQSCSWPHPGRSCLKRKEGKKSKENSATHRCLHCSFKNKHLLNYWSILFAGRLEVLRYQSLPHGPAVHVGLLRADCVCSDVQVSDACQLFHMHHPAFSGKCMHLRCTLCWNCRAKRNTKRQRTSSNMCCRWKTNSTSGYYIKLASHVGAQLYESANKRLSDSADVYLFLFSSHVTDSLFVIGNYTVFSSAESELWCEKGWELTKQIRAKLNEINL